MNSGRVYIFSGKCLLNSGKDIRRKMVSLLSAERAVTVGSGKKLKHLKDKNITLYVGFKEVPAKKQRLFQTQTKPFNSVKKGFYEAEQRLLRVLKKELLKQAKGCCRKKHSNND